MVAVANCLEIQPPSLSSRSTFFAINCPINANNARLNCGPHPVAVGGTRVERPMNMGLLKIRIWNIFSSLYSNFE